tara:strand:- start:2 stop:355 length:354 start_codon:yes stop_codon:yes gene_type:complete
MYVGNLSFDMNEVELRALFEPFGQVTDAAIMMDRETGRPRGFAFVSMDTREGMEMAIRELDGKEAGGRRLTVNEARPREERPAYGGGGGGGRGGDRRGGGGGRGGNDRRGGGGGDRW